MKATSKTWPWFPTYASDWLALRLPPEIKGALSDLRAYAWLQDPPCTLPDDDLKLARISGLNDRWSAVAAEIRWFLRPVGNGLVLYEELHAQYLKQVDLSEKRSTAGRTGGIQASKTRANSKQMTGLATVVAGVVASADATVLPGSSLSFSSLTALKDKDLNGTKQPPSNDHSNARSNDRASLEFVHTLPPNQQDAFRAGRLDYMSRAAAYWPKFVAQHPDDAPAIERQARLAANLSDDQDLTGDGVASRMKRAAYEEHRTIAMLKLKGWPTYEEKFLSDQETPGT